MDQLPFYEGYDAQIQQDGSSDAPMALVSPSVSTTTRPYVWGKQFSSQNVSVGNPAITTLKDGGMLVVFREENYVNGQLRWFLKGEVYNADGSLRTSYEIFRADTDGTAAYAGPPKIATLNSGKVAITWLDNTGPVPRVLAKIFDPYSNPVTSPVIKVTESGTLTNLYDIRLTTEESSPRDHFFLSWQDGNTTFSTIVDASGGGEVRSLSTKGVIDWADIGQTMSEEGNNLTSVAAYEQSVLGRNMITFVYNGNFSGIFADEGVRELQFERAYQGLHGIVSYIDDSGNLWVQRIKFAWDTMAGGTVGSADGPKVRLVVGSGALGSSISDLKILTLSDGKTVLAWSGADFDVHATVLDESGNILKNDFIVHQSLEGNQSGPTIEELGDGRFVIGWHDMGELGFPNNASQQIFDARTAGVNITSAKFDAIHGSWFYGTSFNDTMGGSDGNDRLEGGDGKDNFAGGGGDDLLIGGAGADQLDGGSSGPGGDTVSFRNSGLPVTVDLAKGTGSGNNAEGDVYIDIENVEGSLGGDTLLGNTVANVLSGLSGNDYLDGGDGQDRLSGGDGLDLLIGGKDNDELYGGNQNDTLQGGAGADVLNGGDGDDWADYSQSTDGAYADLASGSGGQPYGVGGTESNGDVLISIEHLRGSGTHDVLYGDTVNNWLKGEGGDDVLRGRGGGDTLDGGSGFNWASYRDGGAVEVYLEKASLNTGDAKDDIYISIQGVEGSEFGDKIVGSSDNNTLKGFGGNDTLYGGIGNDELQGGDNDDFLFGGAGGDVLNGGPGGFDLAMYDDATAADGGVVASLVSGGSGGWANGDTYIDIEGLSGTVSADKLTGDDNNNWLFGRQGDDSLVGGGGNDILDAGDGNDTADGGSGDDQFFGLTGNDSLTGGAGNDTIDGGADNDTLEGGADADKLIGGDGFDYASYVNSNAGVEVDLALGTGKNGDAAGDTLFGIEAVIGSAFADTLTGDDGKNTLDGGNGNDLLDGGANDDFLKGGDGNDTLRGGEGNDYLDSAGTGPDTLEGGVGNDIYVIRHKGDTVIEDTAPAGGTNDTAYVFSANYTPQELTDYVAWLKSHGIEKVFVDVEPPPPGGGGGGGTNGPPTGVEMSSNWVREGVDSGFTACALTAIDPDTGDSFTYKIVLEDGTLADTDGRFVVNGNEIQVVDGTLFDAERQLSVPLKIAIIDSANNVYTTTLDIVVLDWYNENMTGSDRAETFVGGPGDDIFDGGGGNDVLIGGYGFNELTGGAGQDVFVFKTGPIIDEFTTIHDFKVGEDRIHLKATEFGLDDWAGKDLDPSLFGEGTQATTADQRIIYDPATGSLFYDEDGVGGTSAKLIAVLPNLAHLTASSFYVIA